MKIIISEQGKLFIANKFMNFNIIDQSEKYGFCLQGRTKKGEGYILKKDLTKLEATKLLRELANYLADDKPFNMLELK